MVVFQDAMPKKAHYRKFGVRTLDGQDDFAAMAEVISRRFTRLQDVASVGVPRDADRQDVRARPGRPSDLGLGFRPVFSHADVH